jgi:glutathionyl-hydroquinone reductase
MLPEYILAAMVTAVLGWGGFTWRRAEQALDAAHAAADATDKLELKLAEKYLTKDEFEAQMERLFKTLARFEEKLDYHVYGQAKNIQYLRQQLSDYEKP